MGEGVRAPGYQLPHHTLSPLHHAFLLQFLSPTGGRTPYSIALSRALPAEAIQIMRYSIHKRILRAVQAEDTSTLTLCWNVHMISVNDSLGKEGNTALHVVCQVCEGASFCFVLSLSLFLLVLCLCVRVCVHVCVSMCISLTHSDHPRRSRTAAFPSLSSSSPAPTSTLTFKIQMDGRPFTAPSDLRSHT